MKNAPDMKPDSSRKSLLNRRSFLKKSAYSAGALASGAIINSLISDSTLADTSSALQSGLSEDHKNGRNEPTRFIHACMTLPYRNFPLERALNGIKNAGFDHVAWGTNHLEEDGERHPVMPEDADPEVAAELGRRCRDLGLEPVKMFSMVYPDHDNAVEVLSNRIRQASAAEIEKVLIFGPTDGGDPELWVDRLSQVAPIAADHNVMLVLKQHGGETTGTGEALARIINELNHPNILMSYDAGNVSWYLEVDPIPDIRTSADLIRAFCIKDARILPQKATCGPGYGEIDHYQLFSPVAFTGHTIHLAYENIYPPYIDAPSSVEKIDEWARHARIYLENVIAGVQAME